MFIPDIGGSNEAKVAGGSSRSCHIEDIVGEAKKKMKVIFDDLRELVVIQ